jgi:hypothetical protein
MSFNVLIEEKMSSKTMTSLENAYYLCRTGNAAN